MATQYPNNQSSQNVADKGMGSTATTGQQQQKDISSGSQTGRSQTSGSSTDNLSSNQSSSTSNQNKF